MASNTTTHHSPTPWFLGRTETDPGEYDWDGRIWSPPGKQEVEREQASGGAEPAEPYEVAYVYWRPDAQAIVRAVNGHAELLDACRRALETLRFHGVGHEAAEELLDAIRRATER